MEEQQKKSQEEMVQEAVKEAKAAACENAEENIQKEEEAKEADNTPDNIEAEDTEEAVEEAAEEKKGIFSKKNKKDKKDEKIEELTDRITRQMAEFDNFRKRTEKEKSQMYEIGAKDVIEKILPVIDNFERGLQGITDDKKEDPFVQGMEMIYKQILTTLEGIGVRQIEAVGQEFNPDFHNAVMHIEDETAGENVVVEEFQKGYMYRESVVRHSMVKVAN